MHGTTCLLRYQSRAISGTCALTAIRSGSYHRGLADPHLQRWLKGLRGKAVIMARTSLRLFHRREGGQSLIETALVLPILLLLAFNAINFGYFFFVAVNLAASPRSGVQYSIVGFATPATLRLPDAGPTASNVTVSYLTYRDMQGVLLSSSDFSTARVQVCTKMLGISGSGTTQRANCAQYGSGTETYTPAPDPEAPYFVLHRVDVVYEVRPLIPAFSLPTPSGEISLSLLPNLRFHRQVSMRAMD